MPPRDKLQCEYGYNAHVSNCYRTLLHFLTRFWLSSETLFYRVISITQAISILLRENLTNLLWKNENPVEKMVFPN